MLKYAKCLCEACIFQWIHQAWTFPSPEFFSWKLIKIRKNHKMGHRASKIGFSGINRDGFFMKITFPRSVCVRNITFDRFLKIFKKNKKCQKNIIFLKSSKNHSEPVKKSKSRFVIFFPSEHHCLTVLHCTAHHDCYCARY